VVHLPNTYAASTQREREREKNGKMLQKNNESQTETLAKRNGTISSPVFL